MPISVSVHSNLLTLRQTPTLSFGRSPHSQFTNKPHCGLS